MFPVVTIVVYTAFIVYATFRVVEPVIATYLATSQFEPFYSTGWFTDPARYYYADNGDYHYLSPFGTPDFTPLVPGFLFNVHPFVSALLRSPAFLVLPFPALFRFTCYYYRKSYYRAFVGRPFACAVPANTGYKYKGERGLLVLQNLHRYFLYAAIVITGFLAYDALRSIFTPNGLYFGFGSAFMLVNVGFLMAYTFGCHSFRHLVGGKLDCFSCDSPAKTRYGWWAKVTMLNERHALWAWLSLFTVALVDVYIRYVVLPLQAQGVTKLFGVIPL